MILPATMSAITFSGHGGPEVLGLGQLPLPTPAPGEVLIRVAAASVNAPDLAQRAGAYPPPPGASPLLGLDVAGEIVQPVGEWREGDRVVALCNGGGYAEYVAVPSGQVLPIPAGWSWGEAAALPECWFTVTQTLVMRAGLARGMSVLVSGASGGIGGAALSICKILGATPIALVSSDDKETYARALGAAAIIRRDRDDIAARTLELTDGRGADRVLDLVGGDFTRAAIDASARFGHIVVVASLAERNASVPLNKITAKQLTISGSTLRPQTADTKAGIAAHLRRHIWPALADPAFPRPRVQTFPFERAADAHTAMGNPAHFGKIVLVVRD